VYKSFSPPVKGAGLMLDGSPAEAAGKLVSILSEKHLI
jgi:electron transfer flavoprotein beta subunit